MNQTPCDSHYVGALLITQDGGVIVQHRDDNPAIHWPDSLSTFGGGVEGEEGLEEALGREMREELDIDITLYRVSFYKTFYQRVALSSEVSGDIDCHIFLIHDVDPGELSMLEGQGYKILTRETALSAIKASPTMREIFSDYFTNIDKEL